MVLLAPAPEALASASSRLGITVSRKVGNAITRSRVKRGIREWFRTSACRFSASRDVVVIARSGAGELDARQVRRELDGLLQ